mmetsp:Transcript_18227/g.23258  ORF Transcript_18227/g.23258 Transcript_18227/m.23258 type:complete len:519 (+) Transcript_18227:235-1791(+)
MVVVGEDGDKETDYEDKNNKVWVIEDIIRGNCSLFVQVKLAILARRWGRRPRIHFTHGYSEEFELSWTVVQTQGYRNYQEDRTLVGERIGVKLFKEPECGQQSLEDYLVFGVFDGHGQPGEGHRVSEYAVTKFTSLLKRRLDLEDRDGGTPSSNSKTIKNEPNTSTGPTTTKTNKYGSKQGQINTTSQSAAEEAKSDKSNQLSNCTIVNKDLILKQKQRVFGAVLESTCRDLDTALRINMPACATHNGTTMCTLLVGKETLVFANCGDSRAAYYEHSLSTHKTKLKFVTLDHKPTRFDESQRIRRAGGWVDAQRVNGDLAVSRTLGDLEYKPRGSPLRLCPVSNQPEVDIIPRALASTKNGNDEELFLLATDGLWDAISTKDALEFIKERMREYEEKNPTCCETESTAALKVALTKLIQFVSIDRLSSDNISIVLISGQFAKPIKEKQKEQDHTVQLDVESRLNADIETENNIKISNAEKEKDANKNNSFDLNDANSGESSGSMSNSNDISYIDLTKT